jgi:hypothetical protein
MAWRYEGPRRLGLKGKTDEEGQFKREDFEGS